MRWYQFLCLGFLVCMTFEKLNLIKYFSLFFLLYRWSLVLLPLRRQATFVRPAINPLHMLQLYGHIKIVSMGKTAQVQYLRWYIWVCKYITTPSKGSAQRVAISSNLLCYYTPLNICIFKRPWPSHFRTYDDITGLSAYSTSTTITRPPRSCTTSHRSTSHPSNI